MSAVPVARRVIDRSDRTTVVDRMLPGSDSAQALIVVEFVASVIAAALTMAQAPVAAVFDRQPSQRLHWWPMRAVGLARAITIFVLNPNLKDNKRTAGECAAACCCGDGCGGPDDERQLRKYCTRWCICIRCCCCCGVCGGCGT